MHPVLSKPAVAALLVFAAVGVARAEGLYAGAGPAASVSLSSPGGSAGKASESYEFMPNFSLEGGLFDLARSGESLGSVNLRGVPADTAAGYPLAPGWSLLGTAGTTQTRFTSTEIDDSSPALKKGVGLEFDLSPQLALRTQYEHYRFADALDGRAKVGEFTIGLKIGF